jgi:hypothetical protein
MGHNILVYTDNDNLRDGSKYHKESREISTITNKRDGLDVNRDKTVHFFMTRH